MVLDTIVHGEFVFKNKKVKIAVDAEEAPEEFFFVHIRKKNDDPVTRSPFESDTILAG